MSRKQKLKKIKKEAGVKPIAQSKILFGFAPKGVIAALALFSIAFIYFCNDIAFIQDDSYITFRYVKNFINGLGLVFNEGEKVEGYTSFLWTIFLSLISFIFRNIEKTAQYLTVGFGVLILFAVYKLMENIRLAGEDKKGRFKAENIEKIFNIIPSALLSATGAFIYWAVSGMETTIFIFFSLCGVYYYLNGKNSCEANKKFTIFMLLAALTRPEGLYLFAIIYFHKAIALFIEKRKEGLVSFIKSFFSKSVVIEILLFVAPNLLYIGFRLLYYGHPFPNTFYAKTGISAEYFSAGLEYFTYFSRSYLLYGFVLALPLILFKIKDIRFELSLFYLIIILYSAYVIIIGGDVLRPHRFFLPILPFVYILFIKALFYIYIIMIKKYGEANYKNIAGAILMFIIIYGSFNYNQENNNRLFEKLGIGEFGVFNPREDIKRYRDLENGLVANMSGIGRWLNYEQSRRGEKITVAITTIGAISYFSNVTAIDQLGLTDSYIAHYPKEIKEISSEAVGWRERRYNAEYVLSRKPDYVIFSTSVKPSAYAERALFAQKEFQLNYHLELINSKIDNVSFIAYSRNRKGEGKADADSLINAPYKIDFVRHYVNAMNLSNKIASKEDAERFLNEIRLTNEYCPPYFGDGYRLLAEYYQNLGDSKSALENLEKAVAADPLNSMARYNLFNLYNKLNEAEKANFHLKELLKNSPTLAR